MTRATLLQAERVLRRSLRMPPVLVQTIFFPAALLLVLLAAFGEVVEVRPGMRYVDTLVPLMILSGALFGGLGTGAALVTERTEGFLDRCATLPVPRPSLLAGRVLADAARSLLAAVVLLAVGAAVGFRWSGPLPPLGLLGFLALVAVYGSAFSWVVTAVALRARSYESVLALSPVFLALLFLNSGFVPLEDYPGFLRPVVRWAPHTCAVDALAGLAHGGPLVVPVLGTLAWAAGVGGVGAWLSFRRLG